MGRKAKYTKEQKVKACEDYLNGRKSAEQIRLELNMEKYGARLVRKWAKSYRLNGHLIFDHKSTNNKYTKEFKEMIGTAIDIINERYKLRRKLGCETQFGDRYSQIH